jgi:ferredoxin
MPISDIKGCIGCGECVKAFPTNAIQLNRNGILTIVFIILTSFHVIKMERHISTFMAVLITMLSGIGILFCVCL